MITRSDQPSSFRSVQSGVNVDTPTRSRPAFSVTSRSPRTRPSSEQRRPHHVRIEITLIVEFAQARLLAAAPHSGGIHSHRRPTGHQQVEVAVAIPVAGGGAQRGEADDARRVRVEPLGRQHIVAGRYAALRRLVDQPPVVVDEQHVGLTADAAQEEVEIGVAVGVKPQRGTEAGRRVGRL